MTRKEQNKILDNKIEPNINQYKVDRLNAEISACYSGDLNKYEFLTRKDLKYKPNVLNKARFQFSPLGQTFSIGLDKTGQGYQEEGVMKLLKDIRDSLAGGVRLLGPDDNNDNNDNGDNNDNDDNNGNDDNDNDDNDDDSDGIPDLETEEEATKRIVDYYKKIKGDYDDIIKNLKDKILDLETKLKDSKLSNEEKDKLNNEEKKKIYKMLNKFKDNMKKDIDNFNKKSNDYLDIFDNKISKLNNKIFKIKDTIKNNKDLSNAEKNELQNKINGLTSQKNYINNEHRRAVNKIKTLKKEKKNYEELYEDVKNFFDFEEKKKYDFNGFVHQTVFIKILVNIMILMVLIAIVLM